MFIFGTHTVSATATDAAGNVSTCSFTVTVRSPQQQALVIISEVEALVSNGTLTGNQGDGLKTKLYEIIEKLQKGNINAACNQLDAFINQLNALIPRSLTPQQGAELITAANNLKAKIGC